MRKKLAHLLKSFQQTSADGEFSQDEKRALRQLLEEAKLTEEEKAFMRNRLFEHARELTRQPLENGKVINALNWLDAATKTLYKPSLKVTQEAFFSPKDDCVNAIINFLRSARSSLKLCVFTITDDRITRQILQCHTQGVEIKILSDNEKAFDPGSDIKSLAQAGISVRIDATPNHMHHKFAIIDENVLLTGSYNWTRSAAYYNHENILVTNDAAVVNQYLECFATLWPDMEPFPLVER